MIEYTLSAALSLALAQYLIVRWQVTGGMAWFVRAGMVAFGVMLI